MADEKSVVELATELLAKEADNALEQTGGDVWRAGKPLLNDPANQPKAESQPPAENSPSEPAKEGTTPPETKEELIAGKWKTNEDAEKGVHELIQYAKRAMDRVSELEAKIPKPVQEEVIDPVLKLEQMTGIPHQTMNEAIEAKASEVVTKMFAPAIAKIQADQEVIAKIPDYEKEFPKLQAFVDANPDIRKAVSEAEGAGQYVLAREWAWMKFDHSRRSEQEARLKDEGKKREERVKETTADAGVLKPGQTEARTAPAEPQLSDERFGQLVEMARSGHPSLLWRETIGKNLPKDIFPDN